MTVPPPRDVTIVAELAQGFEGKPEQARLLLAAAAAAGADAGKLQLVFADELATPDYKHYALYRSLEMADEIWAGLAAHAATLRIELHLDIFGVRSLRLAERIGAAAVKLHPTDISNTGLLEEVARGPIRNILLGAGGAHSGELTRALETLSEKRVAVLFGYQGYPTQLETNNIARLRYFSDRIANLHRNVSVGFADHASAETPMRYALAAAAVGAGATVLEKHLTLGRIMELEDHESALNPDEFRDFVTIVRQSAAALGEVASREDFGMSESEDRYRTSIRRHVVASRDLEMHTVLTQDHLVLKRTPANNAITDLAQAYGRRPKKDLRKDSPISSTDLE